ncbi:diguanylate cyclase (GGDEF)-like protein [Saccharothrix carnea]|uniref:Diguanylate cyclase (GGDEF)-like protein n=1 Tax=Saccharothrix carnea TaxID=1280637 RepID=A0A2P8I3Y4_SACCR|nr:diguanylate cyclase [Saccharothrix carnea]PSL53177.1 diguanylate cyclase (GGDEF)-like protein [Saccharothrix carnea]
MTEPARVTHAGGSAPTAVEAWALPELFRQVFVGSTAGIAIFDAHGALVGANPALEAMLSPADLATLFSGTPLAGDEVKVQRQFTDAEGDQRWTTVALSAVRDAEGRPHWHVAVVEDTTEQRVLQDYLRHQSLHDVLTGLPNRQSFLPKLEQVLSRPGSITLCYLDVDSVAIVNDGLGYEAGDELLKVVARRLTEVVAGENATVARLGGDEFVVLIEDSPSTPGISALAEAIEAALVAPVRLGGHGVGVSAGMGFVRTSARGSDAMALLRQAHSTLRRAESGGKGQWGIYDEGQDARDRTRLSLLATMPGALQNGEIALDYVPVDRDGDQVAVAARLRWHEAEYGPVSHGECLRFADELGLGGPLAEWVLEEACGFAAAERLPVLVQLSAGQSRDPDLTAPVAEALRSSGLPPERLWLSLSARALGEDLDAVEDNLTALGDMGVRRLLHDVTFALPELSAVERHGLHGVEPCVPPREALAHKALTAVLPLVRSSGALVVSDGRLPEADLVVRS